ncbi:hypothetical protein [Paenibacillus sp. KN14-4R]|uniref:hypothetical protein n=1 Tax=Paenibacillus sp. KN14-4R TaxID=3445773 RepID=UPI003FA058D1
MVKVKIRAFHTIRSVRKKPCKKTCKKPNRVPLATQIKRLRCFVMKTTNTLSKRIKALSKTVSYLLAATASLQKKVYQIAKSQLVMKREIAQINGQLNTLLAPSKAVQSLFESRYGTSTTITTGGGTVSGTVIATGTDFVQILEPTGDIVIIPFANITSVI